MKFADLLRAYRVGAGLSQEELAWRAGLGVRTVGDLERARVRRPHRQTIMLLADALGLSATARDELARAGHRLPGQPEASGGQVPRQLPPGVPHFTGRADALRALADLSQAAADGGTVVISAIDGMAGIGKTALAVHWAHQVKDRFPDGQLYVNLRGFDPGGPPVAPAEALRGFLDALGVPPTEVPAGLDAQAARYRSLLAGRRMLVLLDNARDAEQVRPLFPGSPGCLVLVTSRAQLLSLVAAQGALPLTLDLLTAAEARELLARRIGTGRVGREPHAVDELIELCARLPLALNIMAARAASRPVQSLADLALQLRDAQRRLDLLSAGDPASDVRAVFSWSCQNLSVPAIRMFRLIGGVNLGPDLSAPAAASLAGLPLGQARRALDELTAARLLTEQRSGRFSLHDLLRKYAAELSQEIDSRDETAAGLHRLTKWYGEQAVTAARILEPALRLPGILVAEADTPAVTDPAQALNWHETERVNLVAAVRQSADLGLHGIAVQMAIALWGFFERTRYYEDWVLTGEIGANSARILANDAALGWLLNSLGRAHGLVGNFADARQCLTEALAIRRRVGDHIGEGMVLNSLAANLSYQGQFEEALEFLEAALAVDFGPGGRRQAASALNNIGHVLLKLKRHDEALEHLREAVAIQQELGNRFGEGIARNTLGEVHHDLGQFEDAVDNYRQALPAIQDTAPEHPEHAEALLGLGDALDSLGRTAEASDAWQAAIPILNRSNDPRAAELRNRLAGLS